LQLKHDFNWKNIKILNEKACYNKCLIPKMPSKNKKKKKKTRSSNKYRKNIFMNFQSQTSPCSSGGDFLYCSRVSDEKYQNNGKLSFYVVFSIIRKDIFLSIFRFAKKNNHIKMTKMSFLNCLVDKTKFIDTFSSWKNNLNIISFCYF